MSDAAGCGGVAELPSLRHRQPGAVTGAEVVCVGIALLVEVVEPDLGLAVLVGQGDRRPLGASRPRTVPRHGSQPYDARRPGSADSTGRRTVIARRLACGHGQAAASPPPPPPGRGGSGPKPPPRPAQARAVARRGSWPRWLLWVVAGLLLATILVPTLLPDDKGDELPYTEFIAQVEDDNVASVEINSGNGASRASSSTARSSPPRVAATADCPRPTRRS